MPIAAIDQQLAFALEAFQRELLDEATLGDALRCCLSSGVGIDAYLISTGAVSESTAESIFDFLNEQELGDDAWDSVPDKLFGTLKESLERVELGSDLPSVPQSRLDVSSLDPQQQQDERFTIIESHARGGLGEVFVAQDRQLQRRVAIKQIRERWIQSLDYRERFLREAEITARLEHPGVVPVYAMGKNQAGHPYYAMRLVRGDSLLVAIESFHAKHGQPELLSARLELRQLLTRFVDVCNTIEYAHSRGIIHRDIKPANIMLGKYGETLVVDWGLAKFAGSEERSTESESMIEVGSGSSSAPTRLGSAVGTPQYMSPEQASGAVHRIGPASDTYCLGATLYHVLTGRPPHNAAAGEVLMQIQNGSYPRPRDVKEVPKSLESICLKAMSVYRHARYESVGELKQDLERWLGDERVRAHRDTAFERVGRWSRRHRTGLVAATVATVLLSLGAAVGTYYWSHNERLNAQLDQQSQTRIASASATAESLHTTALLALKNGNYATAVNSLRQATETLQTETSLTDEYARTQQTLKIAESIVGYQRQSRLGQEAIATELDVLGFGLLRNTLETLGVFEHGDWWDHLPSEYLSHAELDRLREQIFSDMLLMNVIRVKRVLIMVGQGQVDNPISALASLVAKQQLFRSPEVIEEANACLGFVDFVAAYRPAASLKWSRDFLHGVRDGTPLVLQEHGVEYTNSTDAMIVGLVGAATVKSDLVQRLVWSPILKDQGIVEEAFRVACTLDPSNYMLYGSYAGVRFSTGKFAASQDAATQAIAIRPDSHWAYLLRSKALYFESRFLAKLKLSDAIRKRQKDHLLLLAVQDANRGLQLAPNDPVAHLFHGDATYELREIEDAAGDWIRYFELIRNNNVTLTWAFFRFSDSELRRKTSIAKLYFKRGHRGPNIVGLLAICHLGRREHDAAMNACNALLEAHPNDPLGLALRGATHYRLGDYESAATDLQQSREIDPMRFLVHEQLAVLQETQLNWAAALTHWEAARGCATHDVQRTAADFGKCRMLVELDRVDEACAVVTAGIHRHPDADWQRVVRGKQKLQEVVTREGETWTRHPKLDPCVERIALFNAGFELGLERHWANARGKPIWWNRNNCRSTVAVTSDVKHSGQQSLRIKHDSPRKEGAFATTGQTVPCPGGSGVQRYRFTCWAKAATECEQAVSIVLDEDWQHPLLVVPSGPSDWRELTAEFTLENGDIDRELKVTIVSAAPGCVWLDDLSIERIVDR